MHECAFVFDRDFIRRGLRRDHVWWSLYRVLFYCALMALIGLYYGFAVFTAPAMLAILLMGLVAILGVSALVYRKAVDGTLEMLKRQSPDHSMRFVADDEHIAVHFEQGEQRYRWEDLRRIWRYPDVWLIEIVKNRSLLFPPLAASTEMKDFITERSRAAGLKVDHVL